MDISLFFAVSLLFHFLSVLSLATVAAVEYSSDPSSIQPKKPVRNPRVRVTQGILEGLSVKSLGGTTYHSFKGIPYAEAPKGKLRFKDPKPGKLWNGVYDATEEGNMCPQLNQFNGQYLGNEDCLYLNVFTPKLPARFHPRLPVMFFIHGGSFRMGSGSPNMFGPDFIIERGTILVSINYRLGVFGFLSMNTANVPGNAGLKDQILALQWVKRNIKRFGGDPDNITIFGISAGAASVEYHLLSPMSRGLFRKAIMESGSAINAWARMTNSSKFLTSLTQLSNLTETDPQKVLIELQSIDSQKLLMTSYSVLQQEKLKNGLINTNGFLPVVEKRIPGVSAFLDSEPIEMLRRGNFYRVPTISGFVKNEGFIFKTDFGPDAVNDMANGNYINYFPLTFDVDRSVLNQTFRNIYNSSNSIDNVNNYLSDFVIVGGVTKSAILRSQFTNTNYFYTFTYNGTINFMKTLLGVTQDVVIHGDEQSYLAPAIIINETKVTPSDKLVRCHMVKMWTDFAKIGNPTPMLGGCIHTKWLPVKKQSMEILEINTELKMMHELPNPGRSALWRELYDHFN